MSQTSAQSPPPPTLQAHTTNPRARKPSRPAHAAVSSPIPSFALAIQSVHRDSISSNIPNSRRSTPKKCLNGTISRLRYKKARGMRSANAQRTQEMPPSCYRRGCQGADGGLICENMPRGSLAAAFAKSLWTVAANQQKAAESIVSERNQHETGTRHRRRNRSICNRWLIQFYAMYRVHPLLLSLFQPSSTILAPYRKSSFHTSSVKPTIRS